MASDDLRWPPTACDGLRSSSKHNHCPKSEDFNGFKGLRRLITSLSVRILLYYALPCICQGRPVCRRFMPNGPRRTALQRNSESNEMYFSRRSPANSFLAGFRSKLRNQISWYLLLFVVILKIVLSNYPD